MTHDTTTQERRHGLLTVPEAAALLNVSVDQVYDLRRRKLLNARNISTGKKRPTLRFTREDIRVCINRLSDAPEKQERRRPAKRLADESVVYEFVK